MAITRVQEKSTGANGVVFLTISFTVPVTTGNCVLVAVGSANPGETVTSITDTALNTYTFVSGTHATNSIGYMCEFWIAKNVTGGFTNVTVNYSGGGTTKIMFATEYSGVSPTVPTGVVGVLNNQGAGSPTTPSLTISASTSALVSIAVERSNSSDIGINPPWNSIDTSSVWGIADIIPGVAGTYQGTFTPVEPSTWGSSGVELLTVPVLSLTLTDSMSFSDVAVKEEDKTLTDSVTSSDSLALERAKNVSDSMTIADSFSLQSSFIAPAPIPVVETLTNAVIPAEVKTFFRFE